MWWAANLKYERGLAGWEELQVWAGVKLILLPAQCQGPFCFSLHQWGDLGMHRDWKETQPGQQPQLTPGNFCVIVLSVWGWGKKKEGGTFGGKVFVFPSNCHTPCCPQGSWTPACLWEWRPNSLFCFARMFCFTFYTVFISHHKFSSTLLILSPIWQGQWARAVWGWVAGKG